ncbi:helix-turn-helix transcriptional regulator [Frigidibacter sp. ROC022]|uniref:helix-turn-helix transcriptional regulator n=1 Tax=Frigidibacter sp. ROC022 TaxID=2971796 RepID=UPI00215A8FBE|nr:helix-turn-helix transcriptional regulator [Frigidibacter sp. ROC022]MCR8726660.1 helix-turn-helix transcriptional regulator [Frigidibacter sp. ROC022]
MHQPRISEPHAQNHKHEPGQGQVPNRAMIWSGLRWPALIAIILVLLIQVASAAFFTIKLLGEVFLWDLAMIPWELQERLELLSSLGLLCGLVSSVALLLISTRRMSRINDQLHAAAGQFQFYIDRQFAEWQLTPTERHVAILVIKGFSNSEIAGLRGTTESTVKSQLTSIFRKANLSSRQQLVACVIEDLVAAVPET